MDKKKCKIGRILTILLLTFPTTEPLINQLGTATATQVAWFDSGGSSGYQTFTDTSTFTAVPSTCGVNSGLAQCLISDTISSTFQDGGCFSITPQNIGMTKLGITLTLGTSVSARTFLSGFTYKMLTDAKFMEQSTTITLELWQGGQMIKVFTAANSNQVWTSNVLISFNQMRLYTKNYHLAGETLLFCIEKIFAIKEYYVNPYIYETMIYTDKAAYVPGSLKWLHYWLPAPSPIYNPTTASFTQGTACTPYTSTPYGKEPLYFICVWNNMNSIPFVNIKNSRLITGVMYQSGKTQDLLLKLHVQYWYWTYLPSGVWKIYSNNPAYQSSDFIDLAASPVSPVIASAVAICEYPNSTTTWMDLCSFQVFGYPFCYASSLTIHPTSPAVLLADSPPQSVSLTLSTVAFYDKEHTLNIHNNFCSIGLEINMYVNGTLSKTGFIADPVFLTSTINYTSAATTPYNTTLSFVVVDTRDPSSPTQTQATSTDFYVYEYWCTPNVFALPQVWYVSLFGGISLPHTVQDFATRTIKSIKFEINFYCNGIWASLAVSRFDDILNSFTRVNSDQNAFDNCIQSSQTICFLQKIDDTTLEYYSSQPETTTFLMKASVTYYMTDTGGVATTPSINSPPGFAWNLQILQSDPPTLSDQQYTVGQTALGISFDAFNVLPEQLPRIEGSIDVYLVDSPLKSNFINLSSSNVTSIEGLSWLWFDRNERTIFVQTPDNQFVGSYKIAIVQSYAEFPEVNPCSWFSLKIDPTPIMPALTHTAPFFYPKLVAQIVNQCSGNITGKLWRLILPDVVDSGNGSVSMQVFLNTKLLLFNSSLREISQRQSLSEAQNTTVTLKLTDSFGSEATYYLKVEFTCNQTKELNLTTYNLLRETQQQHQFPTAFISEISSSGLVKITFPQVMKVPGHPADIQNATIQINGTDWPILSIKIIPGVFSEPSGLKFNWTFVSFEPSLLVVQLNFQDPKQVSSHNLNREYLKVQIYGFYYFSDAYSNFIYPETVLNLKEIPCIEQVSVIELMSLISSSVQSVIMVTVASNFVLSILIQGPLSSLLSSITSLQVPVHILLINLAYPASLTLISGMLMQILTFQIIDFTDYYTRVLRLDYDGQGSFTQQFSQMGYNTLYIVLNFGPLCLLIFFAPVLWVISKALKAVFPATFYQTAVRIDRLMFWNGWVGFLSVNYLFLGVCAALNFHYLLFDSFGNAFNSLVTTFVAFFILLYPFFVAIFYSRAKVARKILEVKGEFMQRYGSVLEELNFKRQGRIVLVYPIATMIRKLCLIATVVYMQSYPTFSVFFVNFQAQVMLMVVGHVQPFSSTLQNKMQLFNEFFVLLTNYHLFLFTDYMLEPDLRQKAGFSLSATICVCVLVNLGAVSMTNASLVTRRLKICYMRSKHAKGLTRHRKRLDWNNELDDQLEKARYNADLNRSMGGYSKQKERDVPRKQTAKARGIEKGTSFGVNERQENPGPRLPLSIFTDIVDIELQSSQFVPAKTKSSLSQLAARYQQQMPSLSISGGQNQNRVHNTVSQADKITRKIVPHDEYLRIAAQEKKRWDAKNLQMQFFKDEEVVKQIDELDAWLGVDTRAQQNQAALSMFLPNDDELFAAPDQTDIMREKKEIGFQQQVVKRIKLVSATLNLRLPTRTMWTRHLGKRVSGDQLKNNHPNISRTQMIPGYKITLNDLKR